MSFLTNPSALCCFGVSFFALVIALGSLLGWEEILCTLEDLELIFWLVEEEILKDERIS